MKKWLLCVFAMVSLTACSYAYRQYSPAKEQGKSSIDYLIQVDDYGDLWDRNIAIKALNDIATRSATRNTVVLLFIHGWHHNADPTDQNLQDFSAALRNIRKDLDREVYRQSRN